MTELQCFLTFILNLPFFKGQKTDVFRFARRLRTILDHDDDDGLCEEATKLTNFDDQIVHGLNSGRFAAVPGYATYPCSVLPKFLFGLTSQVFAMDGTLLDDYDGSAVDALLTGLRLVRRCSIKSQSAKAESAGVADFISAQTAPSTPYCWVVADSLSTMWSCLLDNPTKDLTLGFPGNGVTSDMRFPYVATMSFVDVRTVPPPIRGYMVLAIDRFLPKYFEVTSPSPLIQIYPYVPYPERVSKLVTVPKSFKTDRAITITNTSSVIIGATLRETVWTAARRHGLKACMNVHDQKRSHDILLKFFPMLALLDLKGGSTCFTVQQQLHYLSKSKFARDMFNFSRPYSVKYKKEDEVPITTLTMGDSSCTALLTTNLAFFVLLAIARKYLGLRPYESFPPAMWQTVIDFAIQSGIFDMFAVVGDDVVIPQEIYDEFIEICLSQGVVINTRKSSTAESIHKETCGAWVLKTPEGLRRIYPFRARSKSTDLATNLSALSANIGRIRRSDFAIEVIIANATSFSHQLEYLNTNGYTESDVGSPLGTNPQPRRINHRPAKQRDVPDDIACAFGCRDSKIAARESRRPALVFGRPSRYKSSIPSKYDPDTTPFERGPGIVRFNISGEYWKAAVLDPQHALAIGK